MDLIIFHFGEEFNSVSLRNSILQIPPVSLSHLVGVCLEGCELDALLELDPPHSGVVLHVHGSLLNTSSVMSNLWTINFSQEVFFCLLISGEKYYCAIGPNDSYK